MKILKTCFANLALLLGFFVSITLAEKTLLNSKYRELCNGIYSKSESGGSLNPAIYINWTQPWDQENEIEVLIFRWKDIKQIGKSKENGERVYLCDYDAAYTDHFCEPEQIGFYIWNATSAKTVHSQIVSSYPTNIVYSINHSGYYCIWTHSLKNKPYQALVNWQNAYGNLPASQYPRLPLSGGITIAYSVVLALWMFFRFQYKNSIVPIQGVLLFFFCFSCTTQALTSIVLDTKNLRDRTGFTWISEFIVSVIFSLEKVLDFVLLLIFSWGYTRYSPKITERLMKQHGLPLGILFLSLFSVKFFGISIQSIHLGLWYGAFLIIAVSSSLVLLYQSLIYFPSTLQAMMEKRFTLLHGNYKVLRISAAMTMVLNTVFGLVAFAFCARTNHSSSSKIWKFRWFFMDGWMDALHLICLSLLAFLWRPSPRNLELDPHGLNYPDFDPRLEEELHLIQEDINLT
ncbi:seven transmembrane receptor-like protein [Schizosaccharomyces cryophilus OY26]|uniref:Seven transmembrane receptor-like protein n=1 Tax=Schizosaccharomyces cryophilus (strain OY26 / ATCC MYA-4695 / CBS 11777 / NBRC 106824 / NRRL Y48691) TaxID=653667 RepID=S9W1M1_SCHCR|nr:seven transmembrane receptor-like protein [Schizosaccharomyces cryophilus OY26]EPY53903.1 seven transmembrane receptor-like protein [Schizosaccharomyces cryophilus OY26]